MSPLLCPCLCLCIKRHAGACLPCVPHLCFARKRRREELAGNAFRVVLHSFFSLASPMPLPARSTDTKKGAPARSPVQSCFSFAPSLRRHRGHSPQGWQGRIRYSLFEPASSNLSPTHSQSPPHTHIDCSTLVFLSSSSQPLSLNLNLSPSLPTPSLSPLLFPPQRKNSPHPPLPWAAPTTTWPRSPQRPSSA